MNMKTDAAQPRGIADFRLPRFQEITNVGLYLEQTVRFVNEYLAPLGQPELTGSMVSNYVKQKLLDSPVKKLYNRTHIARLLFMAVAKTVMPLEDIRLLLELQKAKYPLQDAYDYFCAALEQTLQRAFGLPVVGTVPTHSGPEAELLHTMLSAVVHKIYLDQCLAAYRTLGAAAENGETFAPALDTGSRA